MKKKTKNILLISSILLVLLIASLFYFSRGITISKGEFTTDAGQMTAEIKECNLLCRLLSPLRQTVYFSQSEFGQSTLYQKTFTKGDTIYLWGRVTCDDYSAGASSTTKNDAKVTINIKNSVSGTTSSFPVMSKGVTNHQYFNVMITVPADKAGSWSSWDTVECYKTGTTTIVDSKSYDGITRRFTVQEGAKTCPEGVYTTNNRFISTSGYENVKNIECEVWSKYTLNSVSGNCDGTNIDKNCKTVCSSTSYCDNSFSSQNCDGKVSCIAKIENECVNNGFTCGDYNGVNCGVCSETEECVDNVCNAIISDDIPDVDDSTDDEVIDDNIPDSDDDFMGISPSFWKDNYDTIKYVVMGIVSLLIVGMIILIVRSRK